ncbi:UNVERIFIED_CONTAM: hypothetical protein FKN15_067416 [Acipenser sinensis]
MTSSCLLNTASSPSVELHFTAPKALKTGLVPPDPWLHPISGVKTRSLDESDTTLIVLS